VKLAEYLSVPYVIEAESVEVSADVWIRRVAHPELPGCSAEAQLIEDALDQLERRRVELTIQLLRAGRRPPTPRQPLKGSVALWSLGRLGLRDEVGPLLDHEEADFTVPAQ
jgi:hypothetical protein